MKQAIFLKKNRRASRVKTRNSNFYVCSLIMCMFPFMYCIVKNDDGMCFASKKKEYLSQTTIDTLIQQAFVNLNASSGMDIPDAETRHWQAVVDAKETAAKLKAMARGDPNEKYVLWKVNELEHQVFLEERDMVLKKTQKGKKEENVQIAEFNTELGKKRPDFNALSGFCRDMKATNRLKSNEMQRSLDQRSAAITREVVLIIEKALITGDQTVSQREFDYCSRNRTELKIPPEKFGLFAVKIPAQVEAIKQKGPIDQELAITGPFLSHNKIGILRKSITEAQGRFYRVMDDLPIKDRESYTKKINVLIDGANRKEDSLVACCLSILKAKGDDAALDYLEHNLKPLGVSEEKIGQVDERILHKNGFSKKGADTALSRQLDVFSNGDAQEKIGSGIDLTDVRLMAKKKAQQRADSIHMVEEEKARIHRIEQAHADSLKQAAEKRAYEAELLEDEKKANNLAMDIYTLIGGNKTAEAQKKFELSRKNLEKNLSKESYLQLQAMVFQSNELSGRRDDKNENNPVLASKAPSASMDSQSRESMEQNSELNHEKAKQVITQIYDLIEMNKIEDAYKRFMHARRPLEKYCDKEAFAMLESTVVQAYESLGKQEQ
jgi:hypothetical protein